MRRRLVIWLIPLALALGGLSLALAHGPDLFVEQTSSMTPLIKPGDLVIDHRLGVNETLKVGQIVGYRYGDMLVTHRIIGVNH
ncbi:MAG TPA: S26 family signal peptidase, partial [Ktedonobacterales bacterium]|nr:S26 family signal peptidase [Ktedonobacterales bacterium]